MTLSRTVFIEFPEQIPVFGSALGGFGDALVIALSPHASLELERLGVRHEILPDFFDERKIEEFGWETAARTNELVAHIDARLQEHIEPFRTADFQAAWISAYDLKKLYDSVALRMYELSHFIDVAKPSELIYTTPITLDFGETLKWEELSLYSLVLRVVARESGIAGREIEFDYTAVTSTIASGYFRAERITPLTAVPFGMPWAPRITRYARTAALRSWNAAVSLRRRAAPYTLRSKRRGSLPVVVDLQRTLRAETWGDRAAVWFWDRAEGAPASADGTSPPLLRARDTRAAALQPALATAFEAIRQDPGYAAIFNYRGWNWSDVVAPRMERLCTCVAPRLWEKREQAREVLSTLRADTVLMNNPNTLSIKVVADTARRMGITVIGLQHGEYGFRDPNTIQYQDYAFCDELLVTGDGVRDYSTQRHPGAVRTTTVGWTDMDSWRSRQMSRDELCTAVGFDPERPVTVLCFTNLEGNTRALRNAVASDCTTVRKLRRIVDVCIRHRELQFLIKAHPGTAGPVSPFYAYLDRAGVSHVKINSTLQFAGMVRAADLYILNCPSTTLIALSLYDQPTYVFEDWFQWESPAREAVRARCVLDDDIDRFCTRLDTDLTTGTAFRRGSQSTLLRDRYADPFRDGRSAKRASDVVVASALHVRATRKNVGTAGRELEAHSLSPTLSVPAGQSP